LPRLGNPIVTLVLVLLILLGLAIKAEFALEPTPGPLEASPGVKAGLLAQQPKMGPGPDEKNASGPQEECPDAEIVHERLAKGDLETDLVGDEYGPLHRLLRGTATTSGQDDTEPLRHGRGRGRAGHRQRLHPFPTTRRARS